MENITIPMEEYKELLIIKGKYEELKGQQTVKIDWVHRDTRTPIPREWTEVTCNKDFNGLDAVN